MLDVMIVTYNEAMNLPHCLASLQGWVKQVFVIDSGSTDATRDIAAAHDAQVVEHAWEGYARQRNWGLAHLPLTSPWTLVLDADEVITPELRERLLAIIQQPADEVVQTGFFINRVTYFLDKPIRHCGYFPSWNLRLFKRGQAHYENRLVHEHIVLDDGAVEYIQPPMLHWDRRGLEHYVAKHNRYSTLEARQLFNEIMASRQGTLEQATVAADTRRRRWLKRHVTHIMPFPALWRFLYMYVLRLGVLDGRIGFEFCRFIANYDATVALKLRYLLSKAREHPQAPPVALPEESASDALATPEGEMFVAAGVPETASRGVSPRPEAPPFSREAPPEVTPTDIRHPPSAIRHPPAPTQTRPESSPWSFGDKVRRAVWMLLGKPLFRLSFHNWYGFRAWLLRRFGATIGPCVAIRPSVNIEVPWMLDIEEGAVVGDYAILYSLGCIHIGKRAIISQYAHLCAGTHDYTDHRFKLLRTPITIGDDVWIGADAFVGPGVTIGKLSVLGARSSVYKDLPPGKVCVGNPAKPIKDRELR